MAFDPRDYDGETNEPAALSDAPNWYETDAPAAPVRRFPLDGWRTSYAPQVLPQVAEIGNGLFVRTGKRRAA
jgi:hypothetical protein